MTPFRDSSYLRPLYDTLDGGPPRAWECKADPNCGKITRTLDGMKMHLKSVHQLTFQFQLLDNGAVDNDNGGAVNSGSTLGVNSEHQSNTDRDGQDGDVVRTASDVLTPSENNKKENVQDGNTERSRSSQSQSSEVASRGQGDETSSGEGQQQQETSSEESYSSQDNRSQEEWCRPWQTD